MSESHKPLTKEDYERMAKELEDVSEKIRLHPEMNHHFAERLALLAKQLRDDMIHVGLGKKTS